MKQITLTLFVLSVPMVPLLKGEDRGTFEEGLCKHFYLQSVELFLFSNQQVPKKYQIVIIVS